MRSFDAVDIVGGLILVGLFIYVVATGVQARLAQARRRRRLKGD
jgi:hypothetical protein